MSSLLYPNESYRLVQLGFALHNELGPGFSEKVYQDAFEILLQENNIPYEREKHFNIQFHNRILDHDFFFDFLCYGKIIIEFKACQELISLHESQLINYLHVGNIELGLLINFGAEKLEYKWFSNRPNYQKNK